MTGDRYAEAVVAACAAASPEGARLAHERLTADDFTSPAYAAVFTAAATLPDRAMPTVDEATTWAHARAAGAQPDTIWPSELRLHDLAHLLHVPVADLEQLLSLRPVATDLAGTYATRVKNVADLRRLERNTVALHELVRLGDHERALELADRIHLDLTGVT